MAHALLVAPALKPVALATVALGLYLRSVWNRGPAPHWSDYLHQDRK